MSSEGGTRSHPRAGLYVFVPRSQFSKGEGRCDGDERIQCNERERVLEPPCIDAGGRPPIPICVERDLERPRENRIVHDEADFAILRRRAERPVHARDDYRAPIHDRTLVVEPFDRAARLQESDLERETFVRRATVDALQDVVVRSRVGLDRSPAPVEEDPHGHTAMRGREGGFEEGTRGVSPHLVEVEGVDRESHLRGGEQAEDSLRVERRVRRQDDPRRSGCGRPPGRPRDDRRSGRQRHACRFACGNRIRSPRIEVGLEYVSDKPREIRVVHDHGPAAVALMVGRESGGPEILGADPRGAPVDEGVLRMEVAISLHDVRATREPADLDAGRQQTAHDPVFVRFDAADG